jgi:(heptosyl)LPS beta-1,4-glucosyltransferase
MEGSLFMSIKISVVIPVKNEEGRISQCLDALKGWVDEIIIVDDHSDDRTVAIAREQYGAKVIAQALDNDWSKQRNAGAAVSSNDWILQLDVDEIVPPQTARMIQDILSQEGPAKAYTLIRVNALFGKLLYHCGSGEYLRLYDRRSATWQGAVHEQLHIQGDVAKIEAFVEHYPVDSIEHFLAKDLSRAKLTARQFLNKTESLDLKKIRHGLTFKALKLFWKSYVRKKGYKDGIQGLCWCVLLVITSQIFWLTIVQKAHDDGKLKT